jgi:hypothetical protein
MAKLLEHCLSMVLEHHAVSNAERNGTIRTNAEHPHLEHASHVCERAQGGSKK